MTEWSSLENNLLLFLDSNAEESLRLVALHDPWTNCVGEGLPRTVRLDGVLQFTNGPGNLSIRFSFDSQVGNQISDGPFPHKFGTSEDTCSIRVE